MIDKEDAMSQIAMAQSSYLNRLRDEFAIAAMPQFFGTGSPDTRAQSAYAEADAMLRARVKP